MKHKVFIILLLLVQLADAQSKKPLLKIMSATVQNWTGGAKGLSGTTYIVKVRLLSNHPVEFKTLWLDKQSVPFDVQTFFKDPNKKPAEGDSVLLVYVKRDNYKGEAEVTKTEPLAVQYKGEALIKYVVKGKTRYITVRNFSKLKISKGI